ncbi:MAG: DUF6577 family protein [Candidatus Cryptobacteroides sp.]
MAIFWIIARINVSLRHMRNADIISYYAATHGGVLVRKDFMHWFESEYPEGSFRSLDTKLREMVDAGLMERTGYGKFRLYNNAKPSYLPRITSEIESIHSRVKERYPYAKLCIWQAGAVSSFMQHIPNIDILILETERFAAEAVYDDVREIAGGRTVLLRATEKECRLYASAYPSLLVRNLTSEAPVITVDNVTTASLEKILVDITISPEFEFARGAELYTIFENADQMYNINKKSMLRYAARRGKKEEIQTLIKSTML